MIEENLRQQRERKSLGNCSGTFKTRNFFEELRLLEEQSVPEPAVSRTLDFIEEVVIQVHSQEDEAGNPSGEVQIVTTEQKEGAPLARIC